jgi:hypothetical protein
VSDLGVWATHAGEEEKVHGRERGPSRPRPQHRASGAKT